MPKINSKPNLYYYWDGLQPDWIRLCKETIEKNCKDNFNLHILNKDNVKNYTQLPEEYWKIIKPNHYTDFLKAKLIYETGGFWIDADTIVLKDFSDWVNYFDEHDFIGTPGFFGGPKGSKTIGKWYEEAHKIILDHQEFHFAELINPLITRKEYDPFKVLTKKQFLPVWYTAPDINKFWDKELPLDQVIDDTSKVVVLFNNCFPNWFKSINRSEILQSNMLISKLFKLALK